MKSLEPLLFDYGKVLKELTEFEQLLFTKDELREMEDILPFFKNRKHLSAFIGSLNSNIVQFDRLAFDLSLMGYFSCDMVVGDFDF